MPPDADSRAEAFTISSNPALDSPAIPRWICVRFAYIRAGHFVSTNPCSSYLSTGTRGPTGSGRELLRARER